MGKPGFLKNVRVTILLYVLLLVALYSWVSHARVTDWNTPLYVGVYTINGDNSEASDNYLTSLSERDFQDTADFVAREARRYGHTLAEPIRIEMGEPLAINPPAPPDTANMLRVAVWSLYLRYWSWRYGSGVEPAPDIKIFVRYFDPATHERLPHSIGLEKGHVGIVNAFAQRTMAGSNNVVLAHELLHTLGASDKYDLESGLPRHPEGYAEPHSVPLFPQRRAEIMGGRTPLSQKHAETPRSLDSVIVGTTTAAEIGWLD